MSPYAQGGRLPGETASKLGHLAVVQSPWVQSLVDDFESSEIAEADDAATEWEEVPTAEEKPLKHVWAVDGSFVSVKSDGAVRREVAFVKAALLLVDTLKLGAIDRDLPHPLLLQDVMRDSGVQHATVFPLKNVRTSKGTNYDAVRNIVRESLAVDQGGAYLETFKWLSYQKWLAGGGRRSPGFECPTCGVEVAAGLPFDSESSPCPACGAIVFLSDIWGFHLEMTEESAPESVASAYMMVMEHLMLLTAVRALWQHSDKSLVSETLFIKDGPLTLRGQYSKLVPNIRAFFQHTRDVGRPVHVIGQEKSGVFVDHLRAIGRFANPKARGQPASVAVLSHEYVRGEVYRTPNLSSPYGFRTNWGEKLFVKLDPWVQMVLSCPTGAFVSGPKRPAFSDLLGLPRILATLPKLVSHKFEGALFPIELANGIASMSSYPSATILQRFLNAHGDD